jgi:hypothetical protein
MVRRSDDALAWEAIGAAGPGDEVRVALIHDAIGAEARAPNGVTVMVDPEYDQIMESIEWADKVVTW